VDSRALVSAQAGAVALLALQAPTLAQGVRISEIERRPFGDVVEFQVSADGARVVYRADHEVGGRFDLYSAPADGSAAPIRLNQDPVRPGFALVANGARVVFSTDTELLSALTDGSASPLHLDFAATDLTPALGGTHVAYRRSDLRLCPVDVAQPVTLAQEADAPLKLTPDGTGLVFPVEVLDFPSDEHAFLYRVPLIGGGGQVFVGTAEWVDSNPSLPLFVVGNTSVSFLANAIGFPVGTEIRSAPTNGFAARTLGVGTDFVTTANGARVVFVDGHRLLSAPTGGGGAARRASGPSDARRARTVVLTTTLARGNGPSFRITPDQHSVLFRANDAGNARLYLAPLDGSAAPVLLSDVVTGVSSFTVTDSGSHALFAAGLSLYSVPLDLSRASLALATSSVPGGRVGTILSSDIGTRVVYLADHLTQNVFELFSVPIDGGASAVRLNAPLPAGARLDQAPGRVVVTADGTRVVYSGAQVTRDVFELFSAPLDGHAPAQRLSAPRPLAPYPRHVFDSRLAANAPRGLYRANAEDDDVVDLYAFGPEGVVRVDGPPSFPEPTGVVSYRISPDGSRVVYSNGPGFALNEDAPGGLFGVPSDGSHAPVRLTPLGRGVDGYELDPSGQQVVYKLINVDDELYTVPIAGGSSVRIDGGDNAFAFLVTPDGTRVAFTGNDLGGNAFFVVPIDGSAAPRKLLSLSALPAFTTFVLGPDSQRAVLALGSPTRKLLSVRLDGSQPLTGTTLVPTYTSLGPGTYAISADSSYVVYRADVGDTGRVDLYAVPIDGSAPAVRLNGTMLVNRDVTAFALSPDSTRVVYRADQATNDVFELYAVPIDGSAGPIKLNAPLPSAGDVETFALTPDSARVVYGADQLEDGHQELFAVALDGSSAPVRISGPSVGPSQVGAFQIAPSSALVHFLFDTGSGFELLRTRIDGDGAPEHESSPLIPGGNVLEFQLDASGVRAYYLADQEFDENPELYLGLVRPRDRVR
jgi:Tol biopolymer transport system component